MNNHPRFTCKHAWKHQKPEERHHCTLCAGRHPFLALLHRSMVVRPANWYKCEYKRAKQENRPADYRWGADQVTHTDVDGQVEGSHANVQQQQMHGLASEFVSRWLHHCRTSRSSHHPMQPQIQPSLQQEVILPNPGYKIPANLASFIRHAVRYYGESILSDIQQR